MSVIPGIRNVVKSRFGGSGELAFKILLRPDVRFRDEVAQLGAKDSQTSLIAGVSLERVLISYNGSLRHADPQSHQ
jgi:hypothetical protein